MTTSKFFRIFTAVFMTLSVVLGMFAGIAPAFAMAHVDRNTDSNAPVATPGYINPLLPINAPFYGGNAANQPLNADNGWRTLKGEEGVDRQTGCDVGRDEGGLFRNSSSVCKNFIGSK